ncbi:MAG: hypothetical protein WBF06_03875 [Candidatus Acidiferrales bacterium]
MREKIGTLGAGAEHGRKPLAARIAAALAGLFLLLSAAPMGATDLKPVTVQAWDAYIQIIKATTTSRAAGSSPFLSVDEPTDLAPRLRGGEIVVVNNDPHDVPHGLIHDWVGTMFLPNVTLDQVVGVLGDYDHYSDFYKPFVAKSAVLERNGDDETVTLVMVQRAFSVTAAVETDNDVRIVRVDANRAYVVSNAVRVQEIADYGEPNEHVYPEDQRPGYIWREVGVTRLEQRDGGVYVEIETIALSRGIPWAFRWLIEPLTNKLPREIMMKTLTDTRDAVNAAKESAPNSGQNVAQNRAHP